MRVSILTACYNAADSIRDTMESVVRQRTHANIEYIIIDGGSTDGTVEAIQEFEADIQSSIEPQSETFVFKWASEKDSGLYDALNKGIRLATGDVVGICNADDIFASDDVIEEVACAFAQGEAVDLVYADIRFVRDVEGIERLRAAKTTRYCTGRFFRPWMFRFATFPAHPSTFVHRECLLQAGLYSLNYRICADFELMLRLFWKHRVKTKYLPICTHVMRTGGVSTEGLESIWEINKEDLHALRANGIWSCLLLIYFKYIVKVWGYFVSWTPIARTHRPNSTK